MHHPPLILASSSPTRQSLLKRLKLNFICYSPNIDETPHPHESPETLARRLAYEKAHAIGQRYPSQWIIGCDQVAYLQCTEPTFIQILQKPHNRTNAITQLGAASNQWMYFHTSLCLYHHTNQISVQECVPYQVLFRNLSSTEIERYVDSEQPWDCAGSFKCEGLGISLFDQMQGSDQTALMGLPLLALCRLLRQQNIHIP